MPQTGGPARSDANENMMKGIQDATGGDMDFKKKHALRSQPKGSGQPSEDQFKKEYKSSRDALSEFNPMRWREQWTLIKNFTPEECETLENCLSELKINTKYYTSIFVFMTLGFNYW